jgi:hypothetical protein
MGTKTALYSLIYRVRKSSESVRIDTRNKTLYVDYRENEIVNERKIKRLVREFGFGAQSEIRS